MATFKIDTLIDKQDTNEIVRDQIAAILEVEKEKQKDLAYISGKDQALWDFDVYLERFRPWELLSSEDGESLSETALVNVSFDNDTFDNKGSDTVGNQKSRGTFYIDCFAHKNTYKDSDGVFQSGETLTSKDADRIARLVRNILMSNIYTYLQLQGTVYKRYILRREKFQPTNRDGAFFESVVATRITLEVEYKESSPQVGGVDLELLINTCKIGDDGLITFDLNYDLTE